MAIFQKSVVEKFLSELEESVIDSAYLRFKEEYNASRINEIKTLKEEQYQEGFVRDIFVKVLGYTLQPESNYNIVLEKKNETNSKKADGAILKDGNVIGVIELKDNKTKSLDKVKDQAFGYKVNHKGCKYVITSNFQKLRLYVDDATEYEEFDLYSLDKDKFARLYLFLAKESIIDKNLTNQLKEQTKFHEEDITKKLYKDYSSFKHKFYSNVIKNNPQYDKLILFKKSQKFLDRILFILFSEDKKLIPENAISRIVTSWEKADDLHYKPLYELFKILFTHLNKGHKYKSGYEIPAYNGGLFTADEVLDNILVDDEVLKDDLLILSKYDFNTEVDINILGHIFEHSLTELEEAEAEIKGEVSDINKNKRKKDGVFYTPKYITKYIVENTIGKLCSEKKEELKIGDFDLSEYQTKNGKVNSKGKQLFNLLETYKKWLFELKILDPACGSGAFLNQALTYLIKEHKFIDDLIAELTNMPLRLFDIDKAILEKNIYGVDINDESVEIAKLSLWLRTAQKGRKLSNLSNNIKTGNSLTDDSEEAGDKAFDWKKEYPEVFSNGGFDVVIGNPPYVQLNKQDNFSCFKTYKTVNSNDLYALFYEKGISLLKRNGLLGFITPSSFMTNIGFLSLRSFLLEFEIKFLIDLGSNVFSDASVDSAIIVVRNSKYDTENKIHKGSDINNLNYIQQIVFNQLDNKIFNIYLNPDSLKIANKLSNDNQKFEEYLNFSRGVEFGFRSDNVFDNQIDSNYEPILCGGNISKNQIEFEKKYILFDSNNAKIYKSKRIYSEEKVLVKRIGNKIIGCFDDNGFINVCDVYNIQSKSNDNYHLLSISSILNSSLINFYYDTKFKSVKKLFPKIPIQNLKLLPIPEYSHNIDKELSEITREILTLNQSLLDIKRKVQTLVCNNLEIEKLPNKLKNWFDLDEKSFVKLLKKISEKNISKLEELDWLNLFDIKKKEVLNLQSEIDKKNREIDQMVYELYSLTEDEIKLVEES